MTVSKLVFRAKSFQRTLPYSSAHYLIRTTSKAYLILNSDCNGLTLFSFFGHGSNKKAAANNNSGRYAHGNEFGAPKLRTQARLCVCVSAGAN
jgi:hypothetical protein